MVHLPEDIPGDDGEAFVVLAGQQTTDAMSSQALRESIQRKIKHAEGVLIPTLGARTQATAAAAVDGGAEEVDGWEGDGPMPMQLITGANSPGSSSDQTSVDADTVEIASDPGYTRTSREAELGPLDDEEEELVLRFELEAGLKDPAAVYTELLRDYSQFLTELEQVAADGQASEETLKQLDMLDENAHSLLLELDAGVEAITAAAASGTLQLEQHEELREQAAALKTSVGQLEETLARSQNSFDSQTSASSVVPPAIVAPLLSSSPSTSGAPAVHIDEDDSGDSRQLDELPRQQQQSQHRDHQHRRRQPQRSTPPLSHQQEKRFLAPSPSHQLGARSRRSGVKAAVEDDRLATAYARHRSSVRARMAETRSNAMQGTGPRTVHRSALNSRSLKPTTGKRDKSNPKMLTKKMVMQELLLEMHKKWRTMKFVPDSKLNARQVLPSQRSIDALDSSSTLMTPTASSSASADVGAWPGSVTGTDGRTETGGGGGGTFRSTDTLRRPRHGPSADAIRLNHVSARGSGPPGPPGLPRRRPTVATVQRAAELIESRAVKYEHVMDRMNHAFRGDPAGARVLRKSQLGWDISVGGGSSPRKKSGGIASASPYANQLRNPSDPLGIFAKTGGAVRGRATPSFAAPISRAGGSTSSRKSRSGVVASASAASRPGPLSGRHPPGSARGPSDSVIWPRRSPQLHSEGAALAEDAMGNVNPDAIDAPADTEVLEGLRETTASDDGTGADEPDGVQNREALAAAMEAERRQLAQMFDEIDASGASAALEAVALANAEDETNELEEEVEQLKQSIASIASPQRSNLPRVTDGDVKPRLVGSRSVDGTSSAKTAHVLSDAFNYGQATHGVNATDTGAGGARGGSHAQGRSAKQRLNSIKSKQGGVSNMPPMFGMRPKSKNGASGPNAGNRARRAGRRGEQGRDGFNNTTSLDELRLSHDSSESSGASSNKTSDDASGARRVPLNQLKSHGDATRRGGLPPGARVHQIGGAPQARLRLSRSRSDNFAFPIST